ncbi:MAG: hypothetical protein KDA95_06120 [Acidimicrobiales bacterium]|nr:hypothetical protein [Acidimicrobiales bacterium]
MATGLTLDQLRLDAEQVLRSNDRGNWTRPSPRLYPHQWSWDSAFIAIGWAHLDPLRAIGELRSLLEAQWETGMIPHIAFDPDVDLSAYEPGPNRWASAGHAPPERLTSAICQPPVHAIALGRIREITVQSRPELVAHIDEAIAELYPKLERWHRWLHEVRDPDGTGLITILHPWESGLDNSPRWDEPLNAVGQSTACLERPDLLEVSNSDERPTNTEYRRYMFLLESLVALDHDQSAAMETHPFRAADVFFSAILAAADDALSELAVIAHHPRSAHSHRTNAALIRKALEHRWDPELSACLDVDLRTGEALRSDTIATFAPLISGCDLDRSAILVERLFGPSYCGSPGLKWQLPPSNAVTSPSFDSRAYWRGPQWAPITWLLWWGLSRGGHGRSAERLRTSALDQLSAVGCVEYVDPLTGDGLGSRSQSWTAAVALDWLAQESSK